MALQSRFPDNTALKSIAEQYLGWPRRYAAFRTVEALEDHYAEVLVTSEAIDELTRMLPDMSAQAVTRVRRYIQDTTQEPSVICNVPVDKRADGTPSDDNRLTAAPGGSADCLEKKVWRG